MSGVFEWLPGIEDPERLSELLLVVCSVAEMMAITRNHRARGTVNG